MRHRGGPRGPYHLHDGEQGGGDGRDARDDGGRGLELLACASRHGCWRRRGMKRRVWVRLRSSRHQAGWATGVVGRRSCRLIRRGAVDDDASPRPTAGGKLPKQPPSIVIDRDVEPPAHTSTSLCPTDSARPTGPLMGLDGPSGAWPSQNARRDAPLSRLVMLWKLMSASSADRVLAFHPWCFHVRLSSRLQQPYTWNWNGTAGTLVLNLLALRAPSPAMQ